MRGDFDIFGNFSFVAEGLHADVKFSEGDFDGDEVDFGVGFANEFNKIVTVAVHGDEFAAALPWL
mgnify:CR=1 FL=1